MSQKQKHEVLADLDDLLMMFGAALRYSMGRQSYIVGTTPQFILDNLPLANEKWLCNFLADCKRYEEDLASGLTTDRDDNRTTWLEFRSALLSEYRRRGYPEKHLKHDLEEWVEKCDTP